MNRWLLAFIVVDAVLCAPFLVGVARAVLADARDRRAADIELLQAMHQAADEGATLLEKERAA